MFWIINMEIIVFCYKGLIIFFWSKQEKYYWINDKLQYFENYKSWAFLTMVIVNLFVILLK